MIRGGARIQEGVHSLSAYGEVFYRNTLASGVIPQISVMLGPCAGGAVYSPALTDFIIMTKGISNMFITGPEVIKTVTGEQVDVETLGGAMAHSATSGVAHFATENEAESFETVRRLLSYLPSNNAEPAPAAALSDDPWRMDPTLDTLVPADPSVPYDMRMAIEAVFDLGSFMEVHANFAQNAIVGFARLHGQPVGVVAQQPLVMSGVIDIDASDKIARFVRFCDAFNMPLITFSDSPGFMPGVAQEHGGIIRHGAKIVYAYSEATVPKLTVVTRKGYGGAYIVMSSKHIHADLVFAWPTAEIAVMGADGAVNILFRKEIAAAADPAAERARLVQEFRDKFSNPYRAAANGYVDDVHLAVGDAPAPDRCPGAAARQTGQAACQETRQHAAVSRRCLDEYRFFCRLAGQPAWANRHLCRAGGVHLDHPGAQSAFSRRTCRQEKRRRAASCCGGNIRSSGR